MCLLRLLLGCAALLCCDLALCAAVCVPGEAGRAQLPTPTGPHMRPAPTKQTLTTALPRRPQKLAQQSDKPLLSLDAPADELQAECRALRKMVMCNVCHQRQVGVPLGSEKVGCGAAPLGMRLGCPWA